MTLPPPSDPLVLGQHLMNVLDTGARTATYKLAVLVALVEFAVENVPDDRNAAVPVDLDDLAERVIRLYWRQVRDFEGHYLRQSTNSTATIPDSVRDLAVATRVGGSYVSLDIAAQRRPDLFGTTIEKVKRTLVTQPLFRLQRVPGQLHSDTFLFDDSWLTDKVSLSSVRAHGNRIVLYPGVCFSLAQLSGLLKPALMLAWVADVRRKNHFLDENVADLEAHLFGSDRVGLDRPRRVLMEDFGPTCFYCFTRVTTDAHVDHVLPWSRVGIDGLANLVIACPACNSSKSQLLPDRSHVIRALDRGQTRIAALASEINWPVNYERVVSSARGLYATQPDGSPMWLARKQITPLRIDFRWLEDYSAPVPSFGSYLSDTAPDANS
ncbi:HNH endonuclease [Rhodococcoides kyotonense]|uniref:HNH endonuclease n=1 Tax=Rhodococcoides kyotonense TaxID=398843 RepID=UPI00083927F5|nr:HNH endonuclease signature motif containing protein [Rhodococcus kyotonensis]